MIKTAARARKTRTDARMPGFRGRKSGNRTDSGLTVATAGEPEKARGKATDRSTGAMWKSKKGKQINSARKS